MEATAEAFREKAQENHDVAALAEKAGYFSAATSRYYYRVLFLIREKFLRLPLQTRTGIDADPVIAKIGEKDTHKKAKERIKNYIDKHRNKPAESVQFNNNFKTIKDLRKLADYDADGIKESELNRIKQVMAEIEKVIQ